MSEERKKLLKVLLHAYPDRVTARRAGDAARGVMVGGRGIALEPGSIVRRAPLFLSIDPRDDSGGGSESRVSLASAIEEEWLEEVFPHLIERRVAHQYNPESEKVISLRQTLFAGLVVREENIGSRADAEGASLALYEYLQKNPAAFFAADKEAEQLLARIAFLRRHLPDLEFPECNDALLKELLREACAGCVSAAQARGRGLGKIIENRLTWKQRAALDEYAPEALKVPSGSRIRLRYAEDGGPPVLAVRLQELFGWAESPRLAGGRAPVLLHLLGPNFRPVQVTSDLKNFWNTTYSEVRRDLRARYPRHPWLDDPWNSPPVAVGRRRKPG